jgi:hypothetical protein
MGCGAIELTSVQQMLIQKGVELRVVQRLELVLAALDAVVAVDRGYDLISIRPRSPT